MRSDSVGRTPPYRIETERLVIRCWEPQDAPLLKEAIDSSLDHLRPWMPWAREEPQSLAQKVELLRHFRGRFDLRSEERRVGKEGRLWCGPCHCRERVRRGWVSQQI